MRLFLDRGNSSVKWGAHDGSSWYAEGRFTLDAAGRMDTKLLEEVPLPQSAWMASVMRDERDAPLLEQLEAHWSVPLTRMTTQAQAAGVRCAYADPSRLGIDRWLGVIAAFDASSTAIVVDAGTAITVDVVTGDGQHRGGLVAPGIDLMRKALYANTDRIPDEGEIPVDLLGTDTRAAVSGGSLQAAAGFINQVTARLKKEFADARCLLTGGDAVRLQALLAEDVDLRPRLVLEGMLRLANDTTEPVASNHEEP